MIPEVTYPMIGFEEGFESKPYIDSLGYPTIASGFKLGPKNAPLSMYQIEIGKEAGAALLKQEVEKKCAGLQTSPTLLRAWNKCNPDRQAILISMAYQMGVGGLLKFKGMLAAINQENWSQAQAEGLDSIWARTQSPNRAKRQMEVMLTGTMGAYDGLL